MDTIFALASARGRAGVAVLRLSGPAAWEATRRMAGHLPPPRRAALRRLEWQGETIDEALVILFEAGSSFTGEDVAEWHVHGSPAVVSALLDILGRQPGLRLAEPGEYTRRALLDGRMDLSQVEGLADLLLAETEAQRRQAHRVLSGAIGRRAEDWRRRLIRAAALLEATIDFADEDVPLDVGPEVRTLLESVAGEVAREQAGVATAERIRDGFEVAIVGRPNVGKSTLLNALAGRDAALTAPEPGTTRDVIEVRMDIGGLAVTLLDTAGVREADGVERLGVERGRQRAEAADLRVFLVEPGDAPPHAEMVEGDIVVVGKGDLHPGIPVAVSGLTGAGIDGLLQRVDQVLSGRAAGAATATRARHRSVLERASMALAAAQAELRDGARFEVVAEELRQALRALDALVGRVDVEHILDEVFASFCIGK